MKVGVTGATGLVGGQVVAAALAAGHDVVALVRPGSGDPRSPLTIGGSHVERRTAGLLHRAIESGERLLGRREAVGEVRDRLREPLADGREVPALDPVAVWRTAPADPRRALP